MTEPSARSTTRPRDSSISFSTSARLESVALILTKASSCWTVGSAVTFAITGIFGSVLIAGGVYLLHRKDAHAFFTR